MRPTDGCIRYARRMHPSNGAERRLNDSYVLTYVRKSKNDMVD